MICANPDVVVERGDHLVYCAGAIADLYAHAGGDVIYAGKPIGRSTNSRSRARKRCAVAPSTMGGSWRSEIQYAVSRAPPPFNIDSLFVTAGIHAQELGDATSPIGQRCAISSRQPASAPTAVMRRLEVAGRVGCGAARRAMPPFPKFGDTPQHALTRTSKQGTSNAMILVPLSI